MKFEIGKYYHWKKVNYFCMVVSEDTIYCKNNL